MLSEVDKGISKLKDIGIRFEVIKRKYFYLTIDNDFKNKDVDLVHKNCQERLQCNNIFHGKIYPCIQSCSFDEYDKRYFTKLFQDDGIDIYDDNIRGEDILSKLKNPISFCRNCAVIPCYFPWQEGMSLSNDWIISEENELYNNRISLFDYLVDEQKNEIHVAQIAQSNDITFLIIDSKNLFALNNLSYMPIYIWLESSNCYNHFEQFAKKVFLRNKIIHDGIIDNCFVRTLDMVSNIIYDEHVVYPCNIIFFPSTGLPLIHSLRKARIRFKHLISKSLHRNLLKKVNRQNENISSN